MTTPAVRRAILPVLLIEDEPSIMALVSATLERNGRPDLQHKIVIITGDYANEETVTTLRKIGALYLEKPFRVQDLIAAVEKTMGKAR